MAQLMIATFLLTLCLIDPKAEHSQVPQATSFRATLRSQVPINLLLRFASLLLLFVIFVPHLSPLVHHFCAILTEFSPKPQHFCFTAAATVAL